MQHQQVTGLCHVASAVPTAECVRRSTTGSRPLSIKSKTEFCCIKEEARSPSLPRGEQAFDYHFCEELFHIPFTSNNTSSNTVLGTQANHRQRKYKCEQEPCSLPAGEAASTTASISQRGISAHTCIFLACSPQGAGKTDCVQSADVSVSAGSGPVWLRPQLR